MSKESFGKDISNGVPKLVNLVTSSECKHSQKKLLPSTISGWARPSEELLFTIKFPNIDKTEVFVCPSGIPLIEGLYKRIRVIKILFRENIAIVKQSRILDETSAISYVMILRGLKTFGLLKLHLNPTRLAKLRLFGEKGTRKSLDGNDNIFDNDENYSRTKEAWKLFESCLESFTTKASRVFRKIYKVSKSKNQMTFGLKPRFGHLEYYVMINTVTPKEDYQYIQCILLEVFGPLNIEIDKEGNAFGMTQYKFKTKELYGAILKVYRKTEDLIRIELSFNHIHFKKKNSDEYKDLELQDVAHLLREKAYNVFSSILLREHTHNGKLTYEECIEEFIPLAGKHFNKILNRLHSNAGYIKYKSQEKGYPNIRKLVRKNLLSKGDKRSTFKLNPKYLPIISRNFNHTQPRSTK